jgi:RNA 2',3'-cyclic 3'-phosphodiesterase
MGSRRLFAGMAVEATEPLRRRMEALKRELGEGRRSRWVRMENLHVTVEFFGATVDERIPALEAALAAAAAASRPAILRIGNPGVFGSPHHPRVLWLGVESDGLLALRGLVQEQIRQAGWTPEAKAYAPHLTLARLDGWWETSKRDGLLEPCRADPVQEQQVQELILYESVPAPGGVRYEKRGRWQLGHPRTEGLGRENSVW